RCLRILLPSPSPFPFSIESAALQAESDELLFAGWYVRTGRRSTYDFGARQRRRRMCERMVSMAYTTVSVIKGETTITRRVSKKGDELTPPGVSVSQSPSRFLEA